MKSPAFPGGAFTERLQGDEGCDGSCPASRLGSLSVLVDVALRQLRECLVRFLFLGERCFQ